jgi:hypothetical protein
MNEDFEYVYWRMKQEGFHYCFKHYSSFNEIKDETFHQLRKAYLDAADILEEYINKKYKEIDYEED